MADQMNWSAETETFSDLGSDLLGSTEFDSSTFGGVEGELCLYVILKSLVHCFKRKTFPSIAIGVICHRSSESWRVPTSLRTRI